MRSAVRFVAQYLSQILDKYCAGIGQILATTLDKYSEDIATWCQQTSQWQPILTVIWQPWMQVEVSASTLCVWWPTLDKWNVVRILDKYCKDIANIVMTKHAYNVFYQLAKSDRSCLHLHTFNMDLCVTWIEIKYRGKEMCYPILPCLWVPPCLMNPSTLILGNWLLFHWKQLTRDGYKEGGKPQKLSRHTLLSFRQHHHPTIPT